MIRKLLLFSVAAVLLVMGWLHSNDYMPLTKIAIARVAGGSDYANTADPSEVKLIFCGTGSPNRNPFRASPCLALLVKGDLYLFDAGEGAIAKLHEYQAPVLRLRKVFLTHLHSDHASGVAEVLHNTWLYGRTQAVTLVGPPGTSKLLSGIRESYADDIAERMYVLGQDGVKAELAFPAAEDVTVQKGQIKTIHQDEKVTIEAFQVNHPHWQYAYGYRIGVAGKTVVVSGDTTVSDGIRQFAREADYLIHEAMNTTLMKIVGQELEKTSVPISAARIQSIADVHTGTLELAALAQETRTQHLVLTHLIPPVPDIYPARKAFTSGMAERYSGTITVAADGMEIKLN